MEADKIYKLPKNVHVLNSDYQVLDNGLIIGNRSPVPVDISVGFGYLPSKWAAINIVSRGNMVVEKNKTVILSNEDGTDLYDPCKTFGYYMQ